MNGGSNVRSAQNPSKKRGDCCSTKMTGCCVVGGRWEHPHQLPKFVNYRSYMGGESRRDRECKTGVKKIWMDVENQKSNCGLVL